MITRVILMGAALLGLAAGTGFAAEVDFGDLTDTITTTISPDLTALGFTATSTGPESVVVSGILPFGAALPMPTGARQMILTEPASDPFNAPFSDLVFLDAELALGANDALIERIRIEFDSDANGPVVPSPNVPVLQTIPETGMKQPVGVLLQVPDTFQITATSDLGGNETPLPASAWAGLALLGGLATWRVVRRLKISIA